MTGGDLVPNGNNSLYFTPDLCVCLQRESKAVQLPQKKSCPLLNYPCVMRRSCCVLLLGGIATTVSVIGEKVCRFLNGRSTVFVLEVSLVVTRNTTQPVKTVHDEVITLGDVIILGLETTNL